MERNTTHPEPLETFTIEKFESHIPKWGASIMFNNKNVTVTNTCTIDYLFFAIWIFSKKNVSFLRKIREGEFPTYESLEQILSSIDEHNWDMAKQLWIVDFINQKKNHLGIR